MSTDTIPHRALDIAEHLTDADTQLAYFSEALESGHKGLILRALNTIARARGMTALAKDTGVKRTALYAALSDDGNPTLETLLAIINALGLKLRAEAAGASKRELEQAD